MDDAPTLHAAIDELYSGDPAEFIATRKRLVAQIRKAGDKEVAKTVGGLRRPSVAADAVNHLARQQDPPNIPALRELGERMREAQGRMDAATLKKLGAERSELIAQLLADAEPHGAGTASAKDQLTQTFTAALASQEAEDAVCSGNLVNPLSYSGFGDVEVDEAVAVPLRELQQARLAEIAERDAARAERPLRSVRSDEPAETEDQPDEAPAADEPTHQEPAQDAPTEEAPDDAEPSDGPEDDAEETPDEETPDEEAEKPTESAKPAEKEPVSSEDAQRVVEQLKDLEHQAQEAVDAAREALAAAKSHAAAVTKARQDAEDLLDSLG